MKGSHRSVSTRFTETQTTKRKIYFEKDDLDGSGILHGWTTVEYQENNRKHDVARRYDLKNIGLPWDEAVVEAVNRSEWRHRVA